ncbi:MAG TPA: alpha/beta hydrolase [Mariprofundaceae bacterium]|nr:alpha/beta hydrolase [Mariprofundaceae bacterium]
MIHGMWCGAWCWDRYKDYFESAGYRCIAATLPFHDEAARNSPDPRLGRTSLLDYADALAEEIAALPEKPILMGHSMGGLLALMLAARGLAEAAVLLTPASPAGIIGITPSVLRSFTGIISRWAFWNKTTFPTMRAAIYGALHLTPDAERKAVFERLVHESGRAFFEMGLWPFDRRHASRVDATRVQCPMLVIAAGQDRSTPASVVRKLAEEYRHVAEYREFPNHAHWVLGEPGWEEIADSVLDWLRKHEPISEVMPPASSASR